MAKKKANPKVAPKELSEEPFEESLATLEGIVADLEGGELGLADALSRYEEGVARLKGCHDQLARAERKIELLSGVDADGNPVTEAFDGDPTTDTGSRSKRRTAAPPSGGTDVDDSTRLF